MGVVYRATHLGLDRPVALKVIARSSPTGPASASASCASPASRPRLEHPSVVPIYDSREVDGELLVAMKLVEGGDLRRLIDARGPLPPHRAINLFAQVADALDAAHAAGIVHRDVKPHDILVEAIASTSRTSASPSARRERGSAAAPRSSAPPSTCRRSSGGATKSARRRRLLAGLRPLRGDERHRPLRAREADTEPQCRMGSRRRSAARSPRASRAYPTAAALIAAARGAEGSEARPPRPASITPPSAPPCRTARGASSGSPAAVRPSGSWPGPSSSSPRWSPRSSSCCWATTGRELGPDRDRDPAAAARRRARRRSGRPAKKTGRYRLDPESGESSAAPTSSVTGASGVAVGNKWTRATNPRRGPPPPRPVSGRVLRGSRSPANPAARPRRAATSGSPTRTAMGSPRSTPKRGRSPRAGGACRRSRRPAARLGAQKPFGHGLRRQPPAGSCRAPWSPAPRSASAVGRRGYGRRRLRLGRDSRKGTVTKIDPRSLQ